MYFETIETLQNKALSQSCYLFQRFFRIEPDVVENWLGTVMFKIYFGEFLEIRLFWYTCKVGTPSESHHVLKRRQWMLNTSTRVSRLSRTRVCHLRNLDVSPVKINENVSSKSVARSSSLFKLI